MTMDTKGLGKQILHHHYGTALTIRLCIKRVKNGGRMLSEFLFIQVLCSWEHTLIKSHRNFKLYKSIFKIRFTAHMSGRSQLLCIAALVQTHYVIYSNGIYK